VKKSRVPDIANLTERWPSVCPADPSEYRNTNTHDPWSQRKIKEHRNPPDCPEAVELLNVLQEMADEVNSALKDAAFHLGYRWYYDVMREQFQLLQEDCHSQRMLGQVSIRFRRGSIYRSRDMSVYPLCYECFGGYFVVAKDEGVEGLRRVYDHPTEHGQRLLLLAYMYRSWATGAAIRLKQPVFWLDGKMSPDGDHGPWYEADTVLLVGGSEREHCDEVGIAYDVLVEGRTGRLAEFVREWREGKAS